MYWARRLLFPVLILSLVALAAFGVRQVIVSQEPDAPRPLSDEERERLEATADAGSRQRIRDFIDQGGDPCSLPLSELLGESVAPYADLPSLVNDVDLIVTGRAVENVVEAPEPHTTGGRILSTFQVDVVVSGSLSDNTILAQYGSGVMESRDGLARYAASKLDPCTLGSVRLFLETTDRSGVFRIGYQGWARIDGDAVEAAPLNDVFQGYASAQDLVDDVRQMAEEQEAQGLPKGLVLCRERWGAIEVCPGDTFNPYQTFRLDTVNEAFVVTTDPGPSPLALGRVDLVPGSAQLNALLATLDLEVTLEPSGLRPDDLISLDVLTAEPVNGRSSYRLDYSPSTAMIQLSASGGQFPAPPAFQQAVEPFLAAP